ncbi:MAG TPA: hypothetical protein VN726_03310 [Hanamia sp.]|nr:hypothetical protein [Hanamia sp.]
MQATNSPEIRALSILHTALLVGQFLFALISLFLGYAKKISSSSLQQYPQQMLILSIVVGVVSYIAANRLFTKKLEQIKADYKPVSEKFNDYRAASLTRWALIEFASLFSIILFLTTNYYLILVVAVVLIFLFYSTRPTLQKIASDMGVSEIEIEQMKGIPGPDKV